jgi:phospholipase/lecithinase/hemolysin
VRQFKRYGLIASLATVLAWGLAGCGGSEKASQSPKIVYSSVVSFGDSLSDPGAYKVGAIAALGGGLFTVNGINGAIGADPSPSYTWAQLVSAAAVGAPSCAARVGGFGVPVSTIAGCTNYAQGGSRITNPMGTGNTGDLNGALTEPVVTQVINYLNSTPNGLFTGNELVTVQGGANELFAQATVLTLAAQAEGNRVGGLTFSSTFVGLLASGATDPVTAAQAIGLAMATEAARVGSDTSSIIAAGVLAAASQPGNLAVGAPAVYGPMAITAQTAATTAGTAAGNQYAATTGASIALTGMVAAAAELSASVKNMLAKGAKRIVVTNLPDVSLTPYALATITVTAGVTDNSTQQLVLAMTKAFNDKLKADLAGISGLLYVDVFTENQSQIANPSQFGLSNVKDTACDLRFGFNPLATAGNSDGSSLACKPGNLISGNTSRYLFADSVHPTPYGHKLLSQLITKELVLAGWL